MDIITNAQLRELVAAGTPPCVSLYLPTHRQGRDTRQDSVRLKNLLRTAEERLVQNRGMRGTEARDLLEPARALIDDLEFWQNNDTGLALFLAPGFFRMYKLPVGVEDLCHVNDRFEIKPLLPMLEGKMFYVVALGLHGSRLLECTPHGCEFVSLPSDVELNIRRAVAGGEGHQTRIQRHAGGGSPNSPGAFHGQAMDIEAQERENRLFYFRQLDEGIRQVMADPTTPVIIAGADSITPLFRQVSGIKNLVEKSIDGNFERASNEVLHELALPLMEPIWHTELHQLQEQYGAAFSKQLASHELEEIIAAASEGRVGILFVSPTATYYGKFDKDSHVAMPADESDPEAEDLVDRATMEALLTGAQVVVVNSEEVPGNHEVGAIYRY